MVGIDLSKARYADTIAEHRARYDELIPLLESSGVRIGVQNHSGNCVGSAIGLFHLMERYDVLAHVCAILDMAHCGIAGEPIELSVDLLWERIPNLANFKNAYRERINGPEELEPSTRPIGRRGGMAPIRGRGLSKSCIAAVLPEPLCCRVNTAIRMVSRSAWATTSYPICPLTSHICAPLCPPSGRIEKGSKR